MSKTCNQNLSRAIGNVVEAYIDDTIVKSRRVEDHSGDLKTVFDVLKSYNMKLNSSKYAFGVSSGNFLGYIVSQRGIKANPAQVKELLETTEPKIAKEIQVLTERIAVLNRFISQISNKCESFFKIMKAEKNGVWGKE